MLQWKYPIDIAECVRKVTQYNRIIYISFPQMTRVFQHAVSRLLHLACQWLLLPIDWKTSTRETEIKPGNGIRSSFYYLCLLLFHLHKSLYADTSWSIHHVEDFVMTHSIAKRNLGSMKRLLFALSYKSWCCSLCVYKSNTLSILLMQSYM